MGRKGLWGPMARKGLGGLWGGRICGAYGEEGFVGARKAPQLDIIISSENPLIHNM